MPIKMLIWNQLVQMMLKTKMLQLEKIQKSNQTSFNKPRTWFLVKRLLKNQNLLYKLPSTSQDHLLTHRIPWIKGSLFLSRKRSPWYKSRRLLRSKLSGIKASENLKISFRAIFRECVICLRIRLWSTKPLDNSWLRTMIFLIGTILICRGN